MKLKSVSCSSTCSWEKNASDRRLGLGEEVAEGGGSTHVFSRRQWEAAQRPGFGVLLQTVPWSWELCTAHAGLECTPMFPQRCCVTDPGFCGPESDASIISTGSRDIHLSRREMLLMAHHLGTQHPTLTSQYLLMSQLATLYTTNFKQLVSLEIK